MRYNANEIVWEKTRTTDPGSYALTGDVNQDGNNPCPKRCGNPGCVQWPVLSLIDARNLREARDKALTGKFTGVTHHHVSECRMLPDQPH